MDTGDIDYNTEFNGKATAYLLNTTAWSGFKDNTYADYAVGAPTIELFETSYNKTHASKTITTRAAGTGYYVGWSGEGEANRTELSLGDTGWNGLYVINEIVDENVGGLWIASPSTENGSSMIIVDKD